MAEYIDIKKLTVEELAGILNLYPWFGSAREELCERMAKIGGDTWGKAQYADSAMYIPDRSKVADILRKGRRTDYSDADVEEVLRKYIAPEKSAPKPVSQPKSAAPRVAGGDFFSQAQYAEARQDGDNVFSRFAVKAISESERKGEGNGLGDEFCTETLAKIYEEQGYFDNARGIYHRLMLKNPEKSTYFAALIERLEELEIKN